MASDGSFRSIEDILADDGVVIDQDGHELKVTGEYIRYSEETAHLYEQAEMFVAQSAGATALEPELKKRVGKPTTLRSKTFTSMRQPTITCPSTDQKQPPKPHPRQCLQPKVVAFRE